MNPKHLGFMVSPHLCGDPACWCRREAGRPVRRAAPPSPVFELLALGVPVPQPRPRAQVVGGFAHIYTPDKRVRPYKDWLRMEARRVYRGEPLAGPLRVDCQFVLARLKKMGPCDRREPHAREPDRDNLDKAVLDALTGIVWIDDGQVACGWTAKWWAASNERPSVRIRVWEL